MAAAHIRNCRPGDKTAAYYICMKTGDHGDDGEPFYMDDPDALGRIYVGPYLAFEPDLALVLEDEEGVSGYALGALDSRQFFDRYERDWQPCLCQEFPLPLGSPNSWTRLERVYSLYHHLKQTFPEPYNATPSHLHINLLARARGQGHGRGLIETLLERLRQQGSPGVHLGVGAANRHAYVFYKALGFQELSRHGDGQTGSIVMGLALR